MFSDRLGNNSSVVDEIDHQAADYASQIVGIRRIMGNTPGIQQGTNSVFASSDHT